MFGYLCDVLIDIDSGTPTHSERQQITQFRLRDTLDVKGGT